MNKKTFIEKIKALLSTEQTEVVKLQQEIKLKDGSVIMVEPGLEIGATVMNAENLPVDNGMYELEDGSKINVEAGLIIEVLPAMIEEEIVEQEKEVVEYVTKSDFDSLVNSINEIKEKISISMQAQVELSTELDSFKTKPVDEKIKRKEEATDNSIKFKENLKKLDPEFERLAKLYSITKK